MSDRAGVSGGARAARGRSLRFFRKDLPRGSAGSLSAELEDRAAEAAADRMHADASHEGDWHEPVCNCEDDARSAVKAAWPVFYDGLYEAVAGEPRSDDATNQKKRH